MASNPRKCAHPSCQCRVTGKEDYCSASCENAGGGATTKCDCGHSACR